MRDVLAAPARRARRDRGERPEHGRRGIARDDGEVIGHQAPAALAARALQHRRFADGPQHGPRVHQVIALAIGPVVIRASVAEAEAEAPRAGAGRLCGWTAVGDGRAAYATGESTGAPDRPPHPEPDAVA